ncbi:MAG: hypothetical protein OEV64_10975 [Desulfobulbaceae bacterium]|nr:hypothetical protein [Desulfobulbaceae bacterium]
MEYHVDSAEMIRVYPGQIFEVILEPYSDAPECDWSLSFMPQCLNLLGIYSYGSPRMRYQRGGKQIFCFLALQINRSALEFDLLCLSQQVKIVKQKSIPVVVGSKNIMLGEELRQLIGPERFVKTSCENKQVTLGKMQVYGNPLDFFGYPDKGLQTENASSRIVPDVSPKHYFYSA